MPQHRSQHLWLLLATSSLLFLLVACSSPTGSNPNATAVVRSSLSVLPTATRTPLAGHDGLSHLYRSWPDREQRGLVA